MPEVILNSAKISRVLSDQVAGRVLLDYVSDNPGKRKVLGRSFDAALGKEATYLANLVVPKLAIEVKQHYNTSFDIVVGILNEGILKTAVLALGTESPSQLPVNFHKFTRAYYLQKARSNPETSKLFWKFTGQLYKTMRAFANKRRAATNWSKPGVKLLSRGRQRHGMRYRFQIDIHLPEIKGNPFLDSVFRKAFLTAANGGGYGAYNRPGQGGSVSHNDPLSYLQFNETRGPVRKDGQPKTRPFITELMVARGAQMQSILLRKIKEMS